MFTRRDILNIKSGSAADAGRVVNRLKTSR
jgi:hypothetical protein